MAIISTLDRRSSKGKLMLLAIYALLFLGAVSMVYPFLLMLRMTTSDAVDRESISILPAYVWDEDQLARKILSTQYAIVPQWQVAAAYGTNAWTSFSKATDFWKSSMEPLAAVPRDKLAARVADLHAFAAQAGLRFAAPALRYQPGRTFEDRFIARWLADRDGVHPKTYQFFEPVRPDLSRRDWTPPSGRAWNQWRDWLAQLPPEDRFISSSNTLWRRFLAGRYENNLERLNAAHGAAYSGLFTGPVFTPTPPADPPALRRDWEDFAATRYPLFWQELRPETVAARSAEWQRWLAGDPGVPDAAAWTRITGLPPDQGYTTLPAAMPADETAARWWCSFVHARVPLPERVFLASDAQFTAFLQDKYRTLDALNTAWGTGFTAWTEAALPVPEADYLMITGSPGALRWELSIRNFRVVLKSLLLEGGAFTNTFIIVLLSIITSLTVNPLAAYALSRFRMRGTNKILIFLLATMALPGEVAMVPSFLLVRDLHLTDSVWALVLPTAANAFSIFLLKGFFDSLPQELYEAALIDGAGEFTLFTRITIPLSMPIIAVTLLGTVTHAYNLFMPAVMYLGDPAKWPIATKIYEINQVSPPGVGMAALVVSSIFPLLVFIFCQRIIMRGIILPSMK